MLKPRVCKKCLGQGYTGKKCGPNMQNGFKSWTCPDCKGTGVIYEEK